LNSSIWTNFKGFDVLFIITLHQRLELWATVAAINGIDVGLWSGAGKNRQLKIHEISGKPVNRHFLIKNKA
jgi:hypothetical protein